MELERFKDCCRCGVGSRVVVDPRANHNDTTCVSNRISFERTCATELDLDGLTHLCEKVLILLIL